MTTTSKLLLIGLAVAGGLALLLAILAHEGVERVAGLPWIDGQVSAEAAASVIVQASNLDKAAKAAAAGPSIERFIKPERPPTGVC